MATVSLKSSHDRMSLIKTAVKSLDSDVEIVSSEGDILLANSHLMSLVSPLLQSLLLPLLPTDNSTSARIHLPDISKRSLSHLINILKQGYSTGSGTGNSIRKEVQEAATGLGCTKLPALTMSSNNEYIEEAGDDYEKKIKSERNKIKGEVKRESDDCPQVKNGKQKGPKLDDEDHDDEKYSCTKCDYKSGYKSNIKAHHKAVHGKVKYPFSECENKATTKASLNRHVQSVHEGVLFACPECEYKATQRGHLNTHIKSVHEGVVFPCSKCEYEATDKGNLNKHIKSVHEGVVFPCSECEYKATQRSHLNTHMKSVHEGVKYPCSRCDYKATQRSNLNTHMKSIHEGVVFPCSKCEYEATDKGNLNKHIKNVHNKRKHDSDDEDMISPKSATNPKKAKKSSPMTRDFSLQPSAQTTDDSRHGGKQQPKRKVKENKKIPAENDLSDDTDNDEDYDPEL